MKTTLLAVGFALAGFAAFGEDVVRSGYDSDIGKWVIDVPKGVDYTFTQPDTIAELVASNCDLVKIGEGRVITDNTLTNFTQTLYVSNGYFRANARFGVGCAGGKVYVGGTGTFESKQYSDSNWPGKASYLRTFYVRGTGYDTNGAIRVVGGTQNFASGLCLEDDTLIVLPDKNRNYYMHQRYNLMKMNGHKLTVRGGSWFYLVASGSIYNDGDYEIEEGGISFQDGTKDGGASRTLTIWPGASLALWRATPVMHMKAVMKPGSLFYADTGLFTAGSTTATPNNWSGEVVLEGDVVNNCQFNRGIALNGKVSGPGGIRGSVKGSWFQLGGSANTFEGGLSATGVAKDGCSITGGVYLAANGAMPVNGGPLAVDNGLVTLCNSPHFDLPALVFSNRVTMTASSVEMTGTARSLSHGGTGVADINAPLRILGTTDVARAGTLRFARRIPLYAAGLHCVTNFGKSSFTSGAKADTAAKMPSRADYQGISMTGAYWAYNWWPQIVTRPGEDSNAQDFTAAYAGYFYVPGEAGATVTSRFISLVQRLSCVMVDGATVLYVNDNAVKVPANGPQDLGWVRHYWSDPVLLTPGWHSLLLTMDNHWGSSGGVPGCTNAKWGLWPSQFGFGVDFKSSMTPANRATNVWNEVTQTWDYEDRITNATSYVKFVDPGDASFLCASTNLADRMTLIDPTDYRPSFEGPVAVAGGGVIDANDVEPYYTVTIPELIGLPTLTNGAYAVTAPTWTLRASDFAAGVPLTVSANSSLTWSAGTVTVDGDPEELHVMLRARKAGKTVTILKDESVGEIEGTFTVSSRLSDGGWFVNRSGNTLTLTRDGGFAVIIR